MFSDRAWLAGRIDRGVCFSASGELGFNRWRIARGEVFSDNSLLEGCTGVSVSLSTNG